ncbi:hypothetical protein SLA2020_370560 [Shorea laevis]
MRVSSWRRAPIHFASSGSAPQFRVRPVGLTLLGHAWLYSPPALLHPLTSLMHCRHIPSTAVGSPFPTVLRCPFTYPKHSDLAPFPINSPSSHLPPFIPPIALTMSNVSSHPAPLAGIAYVPHLPILFPPS